MTDLTTGGGVEPTFVAGVDWTGNESLEVVYVDADSHTLHYVTLDGTITTISGENGSITVDEDKGVA